MQICVITSYAVVGTIYNLIVNKIKSCVCHGHKAGMGQTYKISAGAPEIDRK